MSKRLIIDLADHRATSRFGETLGSRLRGGEVIELSSDLGGGKTTLVSSIVRGTGSGDHVSSPSFTVRNDYRAEDFQVAHFDFYRLGDVGIVREMLKEAIADPLTTVVIEWGDAVRRVLPEQRVTITLTVTGSDSRRADITYPSSLSYLFKGMASQ